MSLEESVTLWLRRWQQGDDAAIERITALVYRDLRRMAAHYLQSERSGHTLEPTALVHEAYLHLAGIRDIDWKARRQFVSVMAQMMRRILIDHARRRGAAKRNSGESGATEAKEPGTFDALVVDQALTRLAAQYPRHAQVVELRFFGGLDSGEVAHVLDVSVATVERDWRFAKAWLESEISSA